MNKDREFTKFILTVLYSEFLNEQKRYIEKVVPFAIMNYKSTIAGSYHFNPAPEYSISDMKYFHSKEFTILNDKEFEESIDKSLTILREKVIKLYREYKERSYLNLLRFPIIGIAIGILYFLVVKDFIIFYVSIIVVSILLLIWIGYSIYKLNSREDWIQFYLNKELYLNSFFLEETNVEFDLYNQLNIERRIEFDQNRQKLINWDILISEFEKIN